ncbi:MAG: hypothetical protein F6K40_00090 [Okeania sp. SIO3I5]|uniref:hypothetical protein n=1 Tax=Okeania sp. SIO3I5 TaxID=2607805 RepID=UPI0013BBEED4|nr:hypothetical protein [Okeania sp. SIO3I5]NEQ34792.1 hypothetical protein [Okeania sp. SIO3I5]
MSKKQWLKYFKITLITAVVWAGIEFLWTSLPSTAHPSTHLLEHQLKKITNQDNSEYPIKIVQRRVRPTEVWPFVYEKIPDLPLENNYISQETGEVNTEDTLVSRLIRYHFYVKGRAPNYRFDWKLTLADYLGANDYLQSSVYPGNDSLTENPMNGDRQAIQNLTRSQRNALVNRLVDIFGGDPNPPSIPEVQQRDNSGRSVPRAPAIIQQGGADLLKP